MAALRTSLVDAAQALLDLVVSVAAEHDVTLPARRYLTAGGSGNEAWDCEQVVVGLLQLESANAALAGEQIVKTGIPGGGVSLPAAVLRVEIVRKQPTVTGRGTTLRLPSAADQQAAGVAALRDAQLLHVVRSRVVRDATLTNEKSTDVRTGAIVGAGPEGGYAAMALTVAVTLT